jgi:hypothetical protein
MRSAAAFLLAGLMLAGCATPPPGPPPNLADDEAMLAPKLVFKIPPPSAVKLNASFAQTVVAKFRGMSFQFDSQVQITPEELDLVSLNGLGQRAMTVTWKPSGIEHTQAPWLPSFVRPADFLADIAIVFWPADVLQDALKGTGAVVREWHRIRTISLDKRDIVSVKYGRDGEGWNRTAKLKNLAFGYEIDIQSAELGP